MLSLNLPQKQYNNTLTFRPLFDCQADHLTMAASNQVLPVKNRSLYFALTTLIQPLRSALTMNSALVSRDALAGCDSSELDVDPRGERPGGVSGVVARGDDSLPRRPLSRSASRCCGWGANVHAVTTALWFLNAS